jgi:nicotinate-nucleotide adenylyltransferase
MKIALFGGTFDPPTIIHEAIIASCLALPDFDQVWIMPSGVREDKPGMSSDASRLELLACMSQRVFGGNTRLVITEFEMQLPRPTETITTVKALRQTYPRHEFWFVMGADTYNNMSTWRGGKHLQATLPMLVVERGSDSYPPASATVRHVPLPQEILDKPGSSTQVRQAVAAGRAIDYLVSKAVLDCIFRRGLYHTLQ